MLNKPRALLMLLFCVLSGCFGFSSVSNIVIAQPKKVEAKTPLIAPDYHELDASLGVMRGGVGSMSAEDAQYVITDPTQETLLVRAVDQGKLVRIFYDNKRIAWLTPENIIRKVELVDSSASVPAPASTVSLRIQQLDSYMQSWGACSDSIVRASIETQVAEKFGDISESLVVKESVRSFLHLCRLRKQAR